MKILSLVHAHSFLFEKTEIFGPVWPNVSVKNDHPKRIFSKTISRNEVSKGLFDALDGWIHIFLPITLRFSISINAHALFKDDNVSVHFRPQSNSA